MAPEITEQPFMLFREAKLCLDTRLITVYASSLAFLSRERKFGGKLRGVIDDESSVRLLSFVVTSSWR